MSMSVLVQVTKTLLVLTKVQPAVHQGWLGDRDSLVASKTMVVEDACLGEFGDSISKDRDCS